MEIEMSISPGEIFERVEEAKRLMAVSLTKSGEHAPSVPVVFEKQTLVALLFFLVEVVPHALHAAGAVVEGKLWEQGLIPPTIDLSKFISDN